MQKRGLTAAGSQRWLCPKCNQSSTRKRKDNRDRSRLSLFSKWLTGTKHLTDIAKECHVSISTIGRRLRPFQNSYSMPLRDNADIIVLDATSVKKRELVMLIAGDGEVGGPVAWTPASRECFNSWVLFLSKLKEGGVSPRAVVCDGQKGLLKAVSWVWPRAIIQRCTIHVMRLAFAWLTQNPKTVAGQELRRIVAAISKVETIEDRDLWNASLDAWCITHDEFLKEKSHGNERRWWYVHRTLRGVRSLVVNATPDLFRYVSDATIPNTTNFVEGGINNRLKDLFRSHRGISFKKKLILASKYLKVRQIKKPPRYDH